jgi:hypothetical protein
LENLDVGGRIMLKWILEGQDGVYELELPRSR